MKVEISRISPGEWHRVVNQKLPLMFKGIEGYSSSKTRRDIVARWIRRLILQSPYNAAESRRIIQEATSVVQFEAGHPLTIVTGYDEKFREVVRVRL